MAGSTFDEPDGEWTNPPHKSHLCHQCGHVWRPADVPTNGVGDIKTSGKNDEQPIRYRVQGSSPDQRGYLEATRTVGRIAVIGCGRCGAVRLERPE